MYSVPGFVFVSHEATVYGLCSALSAPVTAKSILEAAKGEFIW